MADLEAAALINRKRISLLGKFTIFLVFAEVCAIIALESYVAATFIQYKRNDSLSSVDITVYLMIFLSSQIFQLLLAVDAIRRKDTIQIIGFLSFNICIFIYSLFQYFQIQDSLYSNRAFFETLRPILISISVIIGVFFGIFAILALKLYFEFGWSVYKKIGADPRMKLMYRNYQVFQTLLKLDFFFALAFSVQYLVLVLSPNDYEFAITIIALPITVLILVFAVYGVKRESKIVMSLFILGCFLAMAYFIFKLVRMYQPGYRDQYINYVKYLTFFAVVCILIVFASMVVAVSCFKNFGRGLVQHIHDQKKSENQPQAQRKMVLE